MSSDAPGPSNSPAVISEEVSQPSPSERSEDEQLTAQVSLVRPPASESQRSNYRFWKRNPKDAAPAGPGNPPPDRGESLFGRIISRFSKDDVDIAYKEARKMFALYQKNDDTERLDDAVQSCRRALTLAPRGHSRRRSILNHLLIYIANREDCLGDLDNLSEMISLAQQALELRSPWHPLRGIWLGGISILFIFRHELTGNPNDLSQAILHLRQALGHHSKWHPLRSIGLTGLAYCHKMRYETSENLEDLSEAIRLSDQALGIHPQLKLFRSSALLVLAHSLCARYDRNRDLDDLSQSILLCRQALVISSFWESALLRNLATFISRRYARTGDFGDLSEGIHLARRALERYPLGDPYRYIALQPLGGLLLQRYDQLGDSEALSEAVYISRQALELCRTGHPERSSCLAQHARCLCRLAKKSDPQERTDIDLHDIVNILKEATLISVATMSDRIYAANQWRNLAVRYNHSSQLDAARETLNLLDLAVAESTTLEGVSSRFSDDWSFRGAQGAASDAAALAVQSGDVKLAVSLLEQGRSSIFNQLGRYRSAIDDIREASPELATRFLKLSADLESLVLKAEKASTKLNARTGIKYQDGVASYGAVFAEWTKAVDRIRELPGLGSFLLPPSFDHLRKAAAQGPVVIVNINRLGSDAIIVVSPGDPVLVQLPNAPPEILQGLIDRLGTRPAECPRNVAIDILRLIWKIIVAPVVAALPLTTQSQLNYRIWWCAIGAASRLPLHAAGPYRQGEKNLSQLFTSSYTPTLGALLRARERVEGPTAQHPVQQMLLVGVSETPEEPHLLKLDNVEEEITAVQNLAPEKVTRVLRASEATKEAVLKEIQECNWLHLACHGHHHSKQPFRSHFSMYDSPLTLLDLISKDLPRAQLAILSACHSARVSDVLPDESLHPAAGMMFAGFKSVVGTMWAFDDTLGSALANEFYKIMLDGKKDYTDAAVALNEAFREVTRKNKDAIPFMQRINVVHYGV